MKQFLIYAAFLASSATMASDLGVTLVGDHNPTPVVGKVTSVSVGQSGSLKIGSESGLTCIISKDLAQKNGYDLLALAGQISQNLVDIECALKPGTSEAATILDLSYKVK